MDGSRFGGIRLRRDRRSRQDLEWDGDSYRRATAGTRTYLGVTSDLGCTRSQLTKPEAHGVFGIEADAVVDHHKSGVGLTEREDHTGRGGPGVLADVGEGLLDGTQQDDLSVVRKGRGFTLDLEVSGEAEARAEVVAGPTNRIGERCPLQCGRDKGVYQGTGLRETFPGRRLGDRELAAHSRQVSALKGGPGCLDEHDHAREALRQRVVYLPGEPLPLGERPRFPVDVGQLRGCARAPR